MEIFVGVIIFTSAWCLSAKFVHVKEELSWTAAQEYCRNHHNDLLPLTNSLEENILRESVDYGSKGWIGVYWNQTTNTWRWSGGDDVFFWKTLYEYTLIPFEQLEPYPIVNRVYWTRYKWFSRGGSHHENFFCLSLTVVQEEKTWEEALELCRNDDSDLSSLLSETESLLATNELNQTNTTDPVWIGLRYLGDEWLWVNGDHLDYKNWTTQDHQCPEKNLCGALNKEGVWENRDCQEKLSFICG